MSRETRLVRPYLLAEGIGNILDGVVLRYGRHPIPAGDTVVWPEHEAYEKQPASLDWGSDHDSFERFRADLRFALDAMEIPVEQTGLLVTARSAYLGRTETLFEWSLRNLESLERSIALTSGARPVALRTLSKRSVRIEIHLLLMSALPEHADHPLRPWRKGTWLAHTSYRLVSSVATGFFQVTPLKKAKREELGLGKNVVRYVDMTNCEFDQEYASNNQPVLYVDETVLKRVEASPRTPAAAYFQTELMAHMLTHVLLQASRHADVLEESWPDLKQTLLGRVVTAVVGKKKPDAAYEEFLDLLKSGELGRVAARCEEVVRLRQAQIKNLPTTVR